MPLKFPSASRQSPRLVSDATRDDGRTLEFGRFRLRPATRELWRDGTTVPLTRRAFDLLVVLVNNRGRVMEKGELLVLVWSDAIVEEANLTQNIFTLRKVLGDSQEHPLFIATVPRRGYRFVADVREVSTAPAAIVVPDMPAPVRGGSTARRAIMGAGIVGGVLLAAGIGYWLRLERATPVPTFQQLTFQHQGLDRARFTADGRDVVLDSTLREIHELQTTPLDAPAVRSLGLSRAQVVRVSTAGEIAVLLGGEAGADGVTLAKVPRDGGGPRRIADDVQNADWAPELDRFAILRRAAGLTRLDYPDGTRLYETPARLSAMRISPGRDLVAVLEHPVASDTRGSVVIVDAHGRIRARSRTWGAVFGLSWTPDGQEIWFGRFDGRAYAVGAMNMAGRERDVFQTPDGLIVQDISADRRLLAVRFQFAADTRWQPPAPGREQRLTKFNVTRSAALSGNGRTALFSVEDQGPASSNYTTYLASLSKTGESILTRLGEGSAQGLSADGRWALALRFGPHARLVLLPTGAGLIRELPPYVIEQYQRAQWLPDSQHIVFAGNAPRQSSRLYVQSISGGAPRAISPEGYGFDADGVSPDGRVVVCARESGARALCPMDAGTVRDLPGVERGDKVVRWRADGRALYVYSLNHVPIHVDEVEILTGRRTTWKEVTPPDPGTIQNVGQFLSTADGRAYLYSYVRETNDLFVIAGLK